MKYSKELINEVKAMYPDNTELIAHAERGDIILGRYLDDGYASGVDNETILKSRSLEVIKKIAERNNRKRNLYIMWGKEYDSRNSK